MRIMDINLLQYTLHSDTQLAVRYFLGSSRSGVGDIDR